MTKEPCIGDVRALEENPAWQQLVVSLSTLNKQAQSIRDEPACNRDVDRVHLGIQIALKEVLAFPAKMRKLLEQKEKGHTNAGAQGN